MMDSVSLPGPSNTLKLTPSNSILDLAALLCFDIFSMTFSPVILRGSHMYDYSVDTLFSPVLFSCPMCLGYPLAVAVHSYLTRGFPALFLFHLALSYHSNAHTYITPALSHGVPSCSQPQDSSMNEPLDSCDALASPRESP